MTACEDSYAMYLGTKNRPYKNLNELDILEMVQRIQMEAQLSWRKLKSLKHRSV